ncbi:S-layer homology domain-containing protein [Paenibacillus amylolyticus]|uniref:S-layer homology domain-containing protein n=1 Tax=Paenibacillus amylolyticus TaxID=1451 RepID=UPI00344D60B1
MKNNKKLRNSKMTRVWSRVLSLVMVASILPTPILFPAIEAHADTENPVSNSTAITAGGYPGGVSDGLISWIDVEQSMNLAADGSKITSLTDLVDLDPNVEHDNVWSIVNPNTLVTGAINFNSGILIDGNKGYYVREPFHTTDVAREAFSIQGAAASGFPWHFGGQGSTDTYSTSVIRSSFGNAGNDELIRNNAGNPYQLGQADIFNVLRTENYFGMYLNNTKLIDKTTAGTANFNSATSAAGYYFGAGHNRRFNGLISETILYNRELQDVERTKVYSYLGLKYGITLADNYVASDWNGEEGTVFWNSSNQADYKNRITGIGRDDLGAQDQKQSKSQGVGSNVAIALGDTIHSDNVDNENTMDNNSFFMFADKSANDTVSYVSAPIVKDGFRVKIMDRSYQVDKTNWNDQDITLQVDDAEGLKPSYIILSQDDSFDNNDTFYPVTDGKVTLNSSNFADGSYFTFAAAYPEPKDAHLLTSQVNDDGILNLTFNRDVKSDDLKGFTVTVGGTVYDDLSQFIANGSTISIPLTEAQLESGEEITINYDGSGTLRDALTGLKVDEFDQAIHAVNTMPLAKKVKEALALSNGDYTTDSWNALQNKVQEAQTLLSNPLVTQTQVNDLLSVLDNAIDGLVKNQPKADSGSFIEGESTISIHFDKSIEVVSEVDLSSAFTVTVGGQTVEVVGAVIDGSDPTKLILTLPESVKLSSDEKVNVAYNGTSGYLKGEGAEGTLVHDFQFDLEDPFASALKITEPAGSTSDKKPTVSGTVHTDTDTLSAVLKDADGNVVDVAGSLIWNAGDPNWSYHLDEDLAPGTYTVEVTAVDGGRSVTKTKTFTIVKEALTQLSLTDSFGKNIALNRAFDPNQFNYAATVTNDVYNLRIYPTAPDSADKIEILHDGIWKEVESGNSSDDLALKVGSNTIVIRVTDTNGLQTEYTTVITRASSDNGNNGGGNNGGGNNGGGNTGGNGGSTPAPAPVPTPTAPVKDNLETTRDGSHQPFATSKPSDNKETLVQVDPAKLNVAMSQGTGQQFAIHSPNDGDMKVDGLNLETLKQLVDQGSKLNISNPLAIYPVPGGKMDLNGVSKQLGNVAMKDIAVHVDIARSSDALISSAKNKAAIERYELLVNPVDLDLTFTKDGQTVRSGQLNGYAPKYIALPEGIDPNRITTGVIINPDGSIFHVPTVVTKIDSRYYALINDLRSSGSYSVIWNPQDFEDARSHWGKTDVNNIAARLDLKGNGDNTFSPNRQVTRSEFAEIVVLGLGLMRQDAPQNLFPDVNDSAWFRSAVALANEFGIVRGYDNGNFYGNQEITREQGFAMVARAYRLIEPEAAISPDQMNSELERYSDAADVSNWAKEDVAQLIAAGIIQGNGPEVLSPKTTMTRAEVTALIARMLKVTNLIDQ